MSQLASQSLGSLPATMNLLAHIFVPDSITLVGAGNGSGTVVQWLLSQDLSQVQLLEADQASFAHLTKRVEQNSGWQLRHELIVPGLATSDPSIFYQYTLTSESGLIAPDNLKAIWPNLQLRNQQPAQGITLAGLKPSDWLLLDCLPAAQLLQCAPLKDTQLVLARVTLKSTENTRSGSSLADVQGLLLAMDWDLIALFQERNEGLGKALFVRNSARLRSQISDLTKAKKEEVKGRSADDFSSGKYWESRYQKGQTSGHGSYGRLAEFKAKTINKFIEEVSAERVIEFGCGDGHQLSMLRAKKYIGVDISATIIDRCKEIFKGDASKSFFTNDQYLKKPVKGDISLSIDVIFHLVEDDIFESYMHILMSSSTRYFIIYSSNTSRMHDPAIHVRHRKFTDWIKRNATDVRLMQITYNKYPHDGSRNPKDLSFSDFYFYERV
jgi:hypothetical protein